MENERYRPSTAALEHLKKVNFLAVIGPTGVGKTTLIREAKKQQQSLHLVLNNTSRDPRPDEKEGVDYKFETRAHMEERIAKGEYAQVAPSLFGDLYATVAGDYSAEGVALMPVLADAMPVFRKLPFKSIRAVYILPPDWQTWQERLRRHGFHADKLFLRFDEAVRSLEFAQEDDQLHFVINDDLETATKDFIAIANHRHATKQQQEIQERAHKIVRNLLKELKAAINDPNTI